jgi:hypothetical protein
MLREILRSRKVQIGLSLLLICLSALFLNPRKENPASIPPEIPAAKAIEFVSPPPSNVQTQAAALSSAIDRKIDSIIRLIDEIIE